jgi:hypothetical protein
MMNPSPTVAEIHYVLSNAREHSRRELAATAADPETAAYRLAKAPGYRWMAYHDGRPCAVIGAMQQHPGVWSLFGFGTDDWIHVWRLVTLVSKRDMMQSVLDAGAHRAHCLALADNADVHKWLRFLGASLEVPMPKYGVNQEDFIMFAWLKDAAHVPA